jgi:hypothetical protein
MILDSSEARSSSYESTYSERRDEEHIGAAYKSESKKTTSDASSTVHRSNEYGTSSNRLYPENFKQSDDTLPRRKKSPSRDRSSSPKLKESPREKFPSLLNKAKNAIGSFFGYGGDDKKVESNDESHQVEQCPFDAACQKLDDPIHRAKYRHKGYPEVLIPCPEKSSCRNKTFDHRIKYSHGEQVDVKKDKIGKLI